MKIQDLLALSIEDDNVRQFLREFKEHQMNCSYRQLMYSESMMGSDKQEKIVDTYLEEFKNWVEMKAKGQLIDWPEVPVSEKVRKNERYPLECFPGETKLTNLYPNFKVSE